MAKTIRVIDLLNKIANGEEAPKKVKYCGAEYLYLDHRKDYKNMELDFDSYIIDIKYHNLDWLNDTVEIIQEQQDIDIQEMTELDKFDIQGLEVSGYSMTQAEYLLEGGIAENRELINKILQWAKQIDKNIKDKE